MYSESPGRTDQNVRQSPGEKVNDLTDLHRPVVVPDSKARASVKFEGKAWQVASFDDADGVVLMNVVLRDPRPGELLIRVDAAGAGMPDSMMARGQFPGLTSPGFGLGEEATGIVVAVPDGSRFEVGDRVMGITPFMTGVGGYAEYTLLTEQASTLVPAQLSVEEAGGFPIAFRTAWSALVERGRAQRGETLLVLGGTGSTGSAAIVLGAALGLTVVAAAGSDEKRAFCASIGAAHTVDHRAADFPGTVRAMVGGGVDLVFDPVGGETARRSIGAIARDGRLLIVGLASGSTVPLSSMDLLIRDYSAVGVFAGGHTREQDLRAWSSLADLAAAGKIRPPVGAVVPFDEVAAMVAGRSGTRPGKRVVRVRAA
jgi:NADPH2:quinone reductase